MSVHAIDSMLFKHVFSTEETAAIFSSTSLLQKWLDVESALAAAEARLGIIPQEAAEEIARNAVVDRLDLDEFQRQVVLTGQVIVPLVSVLAAACSRGAGEYIHWGATTQDIMDTGVVLQLKEAYAVIRRDLAAVRNVLVVLAQRHMNTPMAGRTYGQHALPITFGYKVAVWIGEVTRNLQRLAECKARLLVGQLSGAVGTLASLGVDGLQVQEAVLRQLGLGVPDIAWHASRDRFAELTSVLSMISTTQAKIAGEIIALQKNEVAELAEALGPGAVGSSTMPQKRNPMTCEGIVSAARMVRSALTPAHEGMIHEHERDTWWAEWAYLPAACVYTGAVLARSIVVLRDLEVMPEKMRENLALTNGLISSEAVMLQLARRLGRQSAHELVHELAMRSLKEGVTFRECLLSHPAISSCLSESDIDGLLDPAAYVGLSARFVDRVCALAAEDGLS